MKIFSTDLVLHVAAAKETDIRNVAITVKIKAYFNHITAYNTF